MVLSVKGERRRIILATEMVRMVSETNWVYSWGSPTRDMRLPEDFCCAFLPKSILGYEKNTEGMKKRNMGK
jgi:hypothetical protein